jgi:hypothetical protein
LPYQLELLRVNWSFEYIFRNHRFSDPMSNIRFPEENQSIGPTYKRALPAWLSSLVLHAALLMIFVMTIRSIRHGAVEEPDRMTGIVLKHTTTSGEYYEGEDSNSPVATDSASFSAAAALDAVLPGEGDSPLDASQFLPKQITGAGLPSGEHSREGKRGLDGKGVGERNLEGGKARTGVFGLTGEGYKFVYVFDISDSMNAYDGRPLAAAKRELSDSLESFGKLHQFHIIFYNEYEKNFNPSSPGRLFFATEENKREAKKFIRSVTANGSTNHLKPLLRAAEMGPDVIFFLTDGETPQLSADDLRRIERRNGGRATINVIQFGNTPSAGDSWLRRLARQNRGAYQFFNLRRLSPRAADVGQ